MEDLFALKKEVYESCHQLVVQKITLAQQELAQLQESADEETKSSAGDKYETGREMIQQEQEKASFQLEEGQKLLRVLAEAKPDRAMDKGQLGALLETDKGFFYLGPSLGKLNGTKEVFSLSPAAPLGKLLVGKGSGDEVAFNRNTYKILRVS